MKLLYSAFAATCLMLAACSTPKNITYMQNFNDGDCTTVNTPSRLIVQPDDRLSIVVSSGNPELAEDFNLAISQYRIGLAGASSSSESKTAAFTVGPDGDIDYPILGKLHIAGMTRTQISQMIKDKIISSELLKDPIVTVDFLNATVSVLGDVKNPGEYSIDRDDMTILQALSKAGDLNISGMRENVLVVRRENNKDMAYRVNLTHADELMNSPVFYVRQNDVIYIEPNNKKKREANVNGNTMLTPAFWLSVVSVLTTIAVLIVK